MRVDLVRMGREAGHIADRRGLERLSTNGLAQALNIRASSLYSHVSGIEHVQRPLALRGLRELKNAVDKAAQSCFAALRGYRLRGDDAVHALCTMRSFVHGFVLLDASDRFSNAAANDESFAWLIDAFIKALEVRRDTTAGLCLLRTDFGRHRLPTVAEAENCLERT